jgi:hypothetical protein
MSVCSLRWFAEDMVNVGRWLVRETTDEVHARFWKALERLDTAVQPSHVRRGWDGMLAEEAVERVRAEARGDTEVVEPPVGRCPNEGRMCNCTGECLSYNTVSAPSVAWNGPTGVEAPPPLPPPVGPPPNELADPIAEVLAEHRLDFAREPWVYGCTCGEGFNCMDDHEAHQAHFIAERIEKATPPTPFTHGDLIEAEHIAMFYAAEFCMDGGAEQARIRALATRLGDAGHAEPTP